MHNHFDHSEPAEDAPTSRSRQPVSPDEWKKSGHQVRWFGYIGLGIIFLSAIAGMAWAGWWLFAVAAQRLK
jgi:hypothetical protein